MSYTWDHWVDKEGRVSGAITSILKKARLPEDGSLKMALISARAHFMWQRQKEFEGETFVSPVSQIENDPRCIELYRQCKDELDELGLLRAYQPRLKGYMYAIFCGATSLAALDRILGYKAAAEGKISFQRVLVLASKLHHEESWSAVLKRAEGYGLEAATGVNLHPTRKMSEFDCTEKLLELYAPELYSARKSQAIVEHDTLQENIDVMLSHKDPSGVDICLFLNQPYAQDMAMRFMIAAANKNARAHIDIVSRNADPSSEKFETKVFNRFGCMLERLVEMHEVLGRPNG